MLRKLSIAASIAFLAWWAANFDPAALKHRMLAWGNANASVATGNSAGSSDWGGP